MLVRTFRYPVLILALAAAPAVLFSPAQAGQGQKANAKARLQAARKVYEGYLSRYKIGPSQPLDAEKLYQWSRRWLEAQQDLALKKADRVAAAEAHLARMRRLEQTMRDLARKEVAPYEVAGAEFYRLEAERWVAQAKGK